MPIIAVSLIGLYLYLAQPSWYIAWKLQSTTEFSSESRILEMTRLSAFWQYPYWVSYGCALLYHYKLYTMFTSNVKKQDVLVIFFLFFHHCTYSTKSSFIIYSSFNSIFLLSTHLYKIKISI